MDHHILSHMVWILILMEMFDIEYGNKCPRCGAEFGIRCIEFQSCYDCNYPYEKEEKVVKKHSASESNSDDDELPF